MLEKEYFCWHQGQTEGEARRVKATSGEEAAQMAVDIWRHETIRELGDQKIKVTVKDDEGNRKTFEVSSGGDSDASYAFP